MWEIRTSPTRSNPGAGRIRVNSRINHRIEFRSACNRPREVIEFE